MTTKGEYRVGLSFNPSGHDLVTRIKRAAADLIDLIETVPSDRDTEAGNERGRLKALAQTEIESAAMWAVKAATKTGGTVAAQAKPDDEPFARAVAAAFEAERARVGSSGAVQMEAIHDTVRAAGFRFVTLAEVHDACMALDTGRG